MSLQQLTDQQVRERLAEALSMVDLYLRMAAARGITVTLDLVERRSIFKPEGQMAVVWVDCPLEDA